MHSSVPGHRELLINVHNQRQQALGKQRSCRPTRLATKGVRDAVGVSRLGVRGGTTAEAARLWWVSGGCAWRSATLTVLGHQGTGAATRVAHTRCDTKAAKGSREEEEAASIHGVLPV